MRRTPRFCGVQDSLSLPLTSSYSRGGGEMKKKRTVTERGRRGEGIENGNGGKFGLDSQ